MPTMNNPSPKKLTRRDAIKILSAAAGASVLANLPSKWSSPELTSGVLPAHAQTSVILYSLVCSSNINILVTDVGNSQHTGTFSASLTPTTPDVSVDYQIDITPTFGTAILSSPATSSGSVMSSGGAVSLDVTIDYTLGINGMSLGDVKVTWQVGSASCSQTRTFSFDSNP